MQRAITILAQISGKFIITFLTHTILSRLLLSEKNNLKAQNIFFCQWKQLVLPVWVKR